MTTSIAPQRPIWLQIVLALLRLIVLGGGLFYLMGTAQWVLDTLRDRPLLNIAAMIGLSLAAIAVYAIYAKLIERREPTELETKGLVGEWGVGILIGAGLLTAVALSVMLMGYYKVEGLNPVAYLLPALALAIKSGVFEELIFRGVLFQSVENVLGSWVSVVASSLIFGFLHLTNPGATVAGAAYISIEAGLLLSAAFMVTRRLWICIGIHMGWNFVQEGVYSSVVSGGPADPGLLKATIDGPAFWTGGNFGLELSIFALVCCTTAGAIMLRIAIRRGHLLPMIWNR